MQEVPLSQQPNQAFTLVIDNNTYRIRIVDIVGMMAADVNINTDPVINGIRCLHGDFLLPWPSLERNGVNFMWFDDQGRLPHWENFGVTCRLYYVKIDRSQPFQPLPRAKPIVPPQVLRFDGTWRYDGSQIFDGIRR